MLVESNRTLRICKQPVYSLPFTLKLSLKFYQVPDFGSDIAWFAFLRIVVQVDEGDAVRFEEPTSLGFP